MLCDPPHAETFEDYTTKPYFITNTILIVISCLQFAVTGASIKFLFCSKKSKDRPTFVSLSWGLIYVSFVIIIANIILTVTYEEGPKNPKIPYAVYALEMVGFAITSIAHWIFLIEYLKVALRLPIIIDLF